MSWLCECQYKNLGQWLKCHACGNRKPIARASRAMIANRFGDLQIKPKYEYTIDFKTFGEYSIDEWYSMLASNRISKPLRKAIRFKINVQIIKEFIPIVALMGVSSIMMDFIRKAYEMKDNQ